MTSSQYYGHGGRKAALLAYLLFFGFTGQSQSVSFLRRGFQQPPHSARPVVWWHWINGNVTREGITKDLEWMKRAGIGDFQAFDVSIGGGQTIDKKVAYGSPEWLELIRHTAAEAERLGLDMTMVTAAGWSETGGTWVKPNEAMFYKDQRVLAYRTPEAELSNLEPIVTNQKGERVNASALLDDNLTSTLSLEVPKADRPIYLQFEHATPLTARTFSIAWGC